MSTPQVRLATSNDAAIIGEIQRGSWRLSYPELMDTGALGRLEPATIDEQWATAIEHPETKVWLATEGQFAVGFCVAGLAPPDEVASADGELPEDAEQVGLISTLLVEARWGRRGHGSRLLARAGSDLQEQGAQRGIHWVPQSDSAALNFFRRAGWQPDGTLRTLDADGQFIREIRLTGGLEIPLTA